MVDILKTNDAFGDYRIKIKLNEVIEEVNKRVAAPQEDSTATGMKDLIKDFNALLAKLRAAGLMED